MFERAIFRSFCRSLRRILFASVLLVFGWIGVAHATATFSITTTNLSAGDTFQFKISAAGTFYVDCGTDGVLTSTANDITGPVNGEYTITRTNATEATYTCTYQSSGGAKIVQFDGAATGYRNDSTAAIRFNIIGTDADTNVKKISSISGSLGQIFGTITNPTTGVGQPKFAYTFYYASNMTGTSIADPNNPNMNYALPPTLFDGIYGSPAESMFGHTFHNCSGLTGSIPSGLFGNLSGSPAQNMFRSTFQSCSGLTGSIPSGLFGNLSGSPAGSMFYATFQSCSGLTGSIPSGLFGNLSGSPAPSMFGYTFSGCSGLTGSIPSGLFGNLSGSPAQNMFRSTFYNCRGLTGTNTDDPNNPGMKYAIPAGLFGNLTGSPENSMFNSTFSGCSGLAGSIPAGLFGNLTGSPANSMFYTTFQSCSGLTGSIPSGLFGNLSGSPAQSMFRATFSGCSGLTGSIPSGLFGNLSGSPAGTMFRATFSNCRNITGFGDKTYVRWDFLANINTNTSVTEQATNMFYGTQLDIPCPAGTYDVTREQFDDADKPWCKPCPPGTTSPAGSTSVSQCVSSVNLIWETAGGQWPTDPNDNNSSLTNQNSCYWGLDQITPLNQLTRTGYTFAGWKVTNWYHRLLDTLVDSVSSWCYYFRVSATVGGYHAGYNGLCGQLRNSPNNDNTWGLAINNNGVAEKIIGIAKCSDQSTTLYNTGDPGTDNGQYCWCQIISYTSPQGITENYTDLPWVYAYDYTTDTECNANGHCLYECAMTLKSNNTTFRTALFGQTQ